MSQPRNTETIVRQRYAAGAKERADKLCCPVDYDAEYLKVIPREVIEQAQQDWAMQASLPVAPRQKS